jgi:sugar phosphate isomerase/epimerase
MSHHLHMFPKLHNAMWPGLVGKGSPGAEPCLDLDTMLNLTAAAEVNGVKFDGVDIFLFAPHINIDISDEDLKRIADKISAKGLVVGSVVAPIWPPTGGGSAMGNDEERAKFVGQVRKGCRIAARLRALGVRPHGIVRIDSACGVAEWSKDPEGNSRRIAGTFREACTVAEGFGERLAMEGEICWGGLHSWRQAVKLLEAVGRPQTLGFQADMAHTLLFTLGYNAPEDALLPAGYDWKDGSVLDEALRKLTAALRPWTTDFHVAQNDATVKGSGTHDKTGHHCLATDPAGKLDIPKHAGFWLRDADGKLTKAIRHLCWDGCMFPNEVMQQPATWNNILAAMIAVRAAHGWSEEPAAAPVAAPVPAVKPASAPAPSAPAPSVPPPPPQRVAPSKSPAAPPPPSRPRPAKKPVAPAPAPAPVLALPRRAKARAAAKRAKAAPRRKAAPKRPARTARKAAKAKPGVKKTVRPVRRKRAKKTPAARKR